MLGTYIKFRGTGGTKMSANADLNTMETYVQGKTIETSFSYMGQNVKNNYIFGYLRGPGGQTLHRSHDNLKNPYRIASILYVDWYRWEDSWEARWAQSDYLWVFNMEAIWEELLKLSWERWSVCGPYYPPPPPPPRVHSTCKIWKQSDKDFLSVTMRMMKCLRTRLNND